MIFDLYLLLSNPTSDIVSMFYNIYLINTLMYIRGKCYLNRESKQKLKFVSLDYLKRDYFLKT